MYVWVSMCRNTCEGLDGTLGCSSWCFIVVKRHHNQAFNWGLAYYFRRHSPLSVMVGSRQEQLRALHPGLQAESRGGKLKKEGERQTNRHDIGLV